MEQYTPTPARPERDRPESIEERITRLEDQVERIAKKVRLALERLDRDPGA